MFYALYPKANDEPAVILRAAKAPTLDAFPHYGFAEGPFDEYEEAMERAVALHPVPRPIGAGEALLLAGDCPDSPTGRHIANPQRFGDTICVWCLEPTEDQP
jgi:hypothetical protein